MRDRRLTWGALGVTAAAAAVVAGVTTANANAATAAPAAPARPAAPTAATTGSGMAPGAPGRGPSGPGGPRGAGRRAADLDGLVSAVGSGTLSVTVPGGTTTTVRVPSTVRPHAGPREPQRSVTLQARDHVVVRETATGSGVAADIALLPAHVDGTVTSVADSVLTVTEPDGFVHKVVTTGADEAAFGGHEPSTGTHVHAAGRVEADGTTLDADRLAPAPTRPGGPGDGPGRGPGRSGGPTSGS